MVKKLKNRKEIHGDVKIIQKKKLIKIHILLIGIWHMGKLLKQKIRKRTKLNKNSKNNLKKKRKSMKKNCKKSLKLRSRKKWNCKN